MCISYLISTVQVFQRLSRPFRARDALCDPDPGHRYAQPWAGFWRLVEPLGWQPADDRGLARAVRREETEDRAFRDGKRNMIHRREMAEAFGQRFAMDHGFGGHGQRSGRLTLMEMSGSLGSLPSG
jgi:hypothetical protein